MLWFDRGYDSAATSHRLTECARPCRYREGAKAGIDEPKKSDSIGSAARLERANSWLSPIAPGFG